MRSPRSWPQVSCAFVRVCALPRTAPRSRFPSTSRPGDRQCHPAVQHHDLDGVSDPQHLLSFAQFEREVIGERIIITVRRMTSGQLLKQRKGLRIRQRYGPNLPGSSQFALTRRVPAAAPAHRHLVPMRRGLHRGGDPKSSSHCQLTSPSSATR